MPASERKKHKNCLKCDLVPCVNFYRQTGKLEGGEILVLQRSVKERLQVPCEVGGLIYGLCQLSVPLSEIFTFPLFLQCIRDIRASGFLLLCGHYRTSMQVLRPVMENFLTGVYFDIKYALAKTEAERQKVLHDYERFCNGEYEVPESERRKVYGKDVKGIMKRRLDYDFILRWLSFNNLITQKDKQRLERRIGILNKYLHPHYKYTEVAKPICPACPASVSYNTDDFERCTRLFQDVVTELLLTFYSFIEAYLPEKLGEEDIQDALGHVWALKDVEKEIGTKIVFSKDLDEFISKFEFE